MLNLGINNDSIAYEVALELLGQSKQPFIMALIEERQKSNPSPAFINYCELRLQAIDDLQDDLMPDDMNTVRLIMDKGSKLFQR